MSAGRVVDVTPTVRGDLRQGAEAAVEVADDDRSDLACVSGSVGEAGLDDHEGETFADHRFGDLEMGPPLGPIILREPGAFAIGTKRLVDELPPGVGEDREGARVDAFRNSEILHGG